MTKMKSKKMTKSTFAIIIMGIIMVAMLAFGGTFAYFTATTNTDSVEFKTGTISLKSNITSETFKLKDAAGVEITDRNLVPLDKITDGAITVTNASDVDSYTAVVFTFTAKRGNEAVDNATLTALQAALDIQLAADWTPTTDKSAYIYTGSNYQLPKTATNFTTKPIAFNHTENKTEGVTDEGQVSLEGIDVTISIVAYSTQKDNLTITGTAGPDTIWAAMKTALGL